jgi:hypothetical protein
MLISILSTNIKNLLTHSLQNTSSCKAQKKNLIQLSESAEEAIRKKSEGSINGKTPS